MARGTPSRSCLDPSHIRPRLTTKPMSEPNQHQSGTFKAFRKFAHNVAHATGSPIAFVSAVVVILAWAITGPIFHYSDTWQLIINTGTTIITFLMVFLIQNTQNRDSQVVQLKLNELIDATGTASNEMLDIEELTDEQLEKIAATYKKVRKKAE